VLKRTNLRVWKSPIPKFTWLRAVLTIAAALAAIGDSAVNLYRWNIPAAKAGEVLRHDFLDRR
jgi:hypothetical protein